MLHGAGEEPSSTLVQRSRWRSEMREKVWLQPFSPLSIDVLAAALTAWIGMHPDEQSGPSRKTSDAEEASAKRVLEAHSTRGLGHRNKLQMANGHDASRCVSSSHDPPLFYLSHPRVVVH